MSIIPLTVNDTVKHPVTTLVTPTDKPFGSVMSNTTGSYSLPLVASLVTTPNVTTTATSTLSVSKGAWHCVELSDKTSLRNSLAHGSGGAAVLPAGTRTTDSPACSTLGPQGNQAREMTTKLVPLPNSCSHRVGSKVASARMSVATAHMVPTIGTGVSGPFE